MLPSRSQFVTWAFATDVQQHHTRHTPWRYFLTIISEVADSGTKFPFRTRPIWLKYRSKYGWNQGCKKVIINPLEIARSRCVLSLQPLMPVRLTYQRCHFPGRSASLWICWPKTYLSFRFFFYNEMKLRENDKARKPLHSFAICHLDFLIISPSRGPCLYLQLNLFDPNCTYFWQSLFKISSQIEWFGWSVMWSKPYKKLSSDRKLFRHNIASLILSLRSLKNAKLQSMLAHSKSKVLSHAFRWSLSLFQAARAANRGNSMSRAAASAHHGAVSKIFADNGVGT